MNEQILNPFSCTILPVNTNTKSESSLLLKQETRKQPATLTHEQPNKYSRRYINSNNSYTHGVRKQHTALVLDNQKNISMKIHQNQQTNIYKNNAPTMKNFCLNLELLLTRLSPVITDLQISATKRGSILGSPKNSLYSQSNNNGSSRLFQNSVLIQKGSRKNMADFGNQSKTRLTAKNNIRSSKQLLLKRANSKNSDLRIVDNSIINDSAQRRKTANITMTKSTIISSNGLATIQGNTNHSNNKNIAITPVHPISCKSELDMVFREILSRNCSIQKQISEYFSMYSAYCISHKITFPSHSSINEMNSQVKVQARGSTAKTETTSKRLALGNYIRNAKFEYGKNMPKKSKTSSQRLEKAQELETLNDQNIKKTTGNQEKDEQQHQMEYSTEDGIQTEQKPDEYSKSKRCHTGDLANKEGKLSGNAQSFIHHIPNIRYNPEISLRYVIPSLSVFGVSRSTPKCDLSPFLQPGAPENIHDCSMPEASLTGSRWEHTNKFTSSSMRKLHVNEKGYYLPQRRIGSGSTASNSRQLMNRELSLKVGWMMDYRRKMKLLLTGTNPSLIDECRNEAMNIHRSSGHRLVLVNSSGHDNKFEKGLRISSIRPAGNR